MTNAGKRWISAAAWLWLPLVAVLAAVAVYYWKLAYDLGRTPDSPGLVAITTLAMLVFAAFGGLIVQHRPRNPIGWIFCGAAMLVAVRGASFAYATWGLAARDVAGWRLVAWLSGWVWPPAIGSLGTFLPLVFPDGKLLSRRWRPVAWLSAVTIATIVVAVAFAPGPLEDFPSVDNPLAAPASMSGLFDVLQASFMLLLVCIALSVASLVLRARRAGPVEREQIKWIGYVAAFFAVGVPIVFTALEFNTLGALLIFGPLCGIPVASAVAIYRFRLFEIDRLISRTFSYAIVTALLGGLFLLVALVPTAVVGTGDAPDWLIAIATLAVAAAFRPVRRRVQGAVDRRFNRARYDAARTIEAFSARLREEIHLDALGAELKDIAQRTMHPAGVSLWLAPRRRP